MGVLDSRAYLLDPEQKTILSALPCVKTVSSSHGCASLIIRRAPDIHHPFSALPDMASFEYDDLDLEGPAFRLLRLRSGEGPDIHCELFQAQVQERESAISYEALSYTWGSTETTDGITLDGKGLDITRNLYLALQHLRYRDHDRIMWVDAICINQSNHKERGHQVQQMGAIYQQADQVIFWLGEATNETNVVMDALRRLQEESLEYVCRDWRRTDQRWMDIWITIQRDLQSKHSNPAAHLRDGLQSLLHRPWFRRVWILQEVANARAASVYCGTKSVRARFFALAPLFMDIKPDSHCQAVLDIMPGPSRKDSWWSQSRDLYALLSKFASAEAHDPRDMVYALLGISSDARNLDILRADYEKSVQELIRDVFQFLYFCSIDSVRTEPVETMQHLLAKLKPFNNMAFEKSIESSDMKKSALILKRRDLNITTILRMATAKNFKSAEELAELFHCKERKPAAQILLDRVSNVGSEPKDSRKLLRWVTGKEHEAVMHLLLHQGVEVECTDEDGRTVLSWAVGNGENAVVKLLLDKGADIGTKDNDGRTPLSWAVENGHEVVTRLLLDKGANIDVVDYSGLRPLNRAVMKGHGGVVGLLLDRGAKIDFKNKDDQTLLLWAVQNGHEAVVQLLLDRGAEFKRANNYGYTPLLCAAENGHEAVVRLLLDAGANVEANNRWGSTLLSYAAENGHEAVVRLLLDAGADVEANNGLDRTPLLYAAENGHEAIVQLLLNAGADVEANNRWDWTPLSYAAKNWHEAVVNFLKLHVLKRSSA